jgi:hypothetical protein
MTRIPLLLFLAAAIASAQQAVNYASIGGRVTDPSGAAVEAADVTVRRVDTNISSTYKTDHDGRFLFPYLSVGGYEVSVRHPGFQEARRPVALTVGADFDLPFSLVVGQMDTRIQVSADAPILEGARTQIASTISQNEVKDLPLSGRNYFDIALFVAGVSPTNTAANQLFAETSAGESPSAASGTSPTASSSTA